MPKAKAPAAPIPVEPWLAAKHAEMVVKPGVHFIYLLVDEDGARLIADGEVPDYVQRQARRALEWTLADARQPPKPGW